jgi:hypothetical protein
MLPDLTTDWEFEPHATWLKEERKDGVAGRGKKNTHAKSTKTRSEYRGFKEDLKTKRSRYMKWQRRF